MVFRNLGKLFERRRDRCATGPVEGSLFFLTLMLTASLLLFGPSQARTETDQAGEYQVKAAYMSHFVRFVEWPPDASGNVSPTLAICVLGKSPFGNALNSIAGKTFRGRRVVITYAKAIEELEACDILFVSVSEKGKLAQVLALVASRPILTISDIKRFVSAGGMIGFVSANEKVRFEINKRVALRSSLRVSAQLLKLATMVAE
jgi:hypothetical protein